MDNKIKQDQEPLVHDGKKVNIEDSISHLLIDRPRLTSINESKLREEVSRNPKFLIEAAAFMRMELVYIN